MPEGFERLAQRLTEAAHRLERARTERDSLICELHDAGVGLRELGRIAGMTHAGVRRVLVREGRLN